MSRLNSKAISTLDDKITKHMQPQWEGHHSMTVNKSDSVHSFHRSSTHIRLTKLQLTEIFYREGIMQGFLGVHYFWL